MYDDLLEDEDLECLDDCGKSACQGDIELRFPLSASGKSFPRCDYHWEIRLREQDRINENYPDSPNAPDWFDPMDAGEYWDDDY